MSNLEDAICCDFPLSREEEEEEIMYAILFSPFFPLQVAGLFEDSQVEEAACLLLGFQYWPASTAACLPSCRV